MRDCTKCSTIKGEGGGSGRKNTYLNCYMQFCTVPFRLAMIIIIFTKERRRFARNMLSLGGEAHKYLNGK